MLYKNVGTSFFHFVVDFLFVLIGLFG